MKRQLFFKNFPSLVCLIVLLICCQGVPAQEKKSEDSRRFHRQIFVPFESLDVLLDGNSNRVLLTNKEYEDLLKSARTREVKRAPLDSAVVSAKYSGTVSDGVAMMTGELIVEPLNEGLVQVPLPFSGVAIRSARLGNQPANLWRNEKGEIVLLMSGEIRETLKVELTIPMQTTAARQSMAIQLPAPAAAQFELSVPGNVEVKSGAAVIERTYQDASDTTEFQLLPTRGPMNIVMSLNNRLLKDDQVVVSRSVMIHRLTPHVREMHVTCSLDIIHGAMEEIEFEVPTGFQISDVSTELLSQWRISGDRLVVKLRQPTREDIVLSIAASIDEGSVGGWKATDLRPIGVAGHVSVVGVLADVGLKSSQLESTGVIPIDHAFLLAALPESLRASRTESPVAVVAAYYAPQKDYSIAANFTIPAPELIVKSNSRLVIDGQQLELQGGISLNCKHDSRFDFKIALPKSWRLNQLTDEGGKKIEFDRLSSEAESEFLVRLPSRLREHQATKIFFKASMTPSGWLESWQSNGIEFPVLSIEGQTEHSGAIAVATDEDMVIKPVIAEGLALLDEADKKKFGLGQAYSQLAYQFGGSNLAREATLEKGIGGLYRLQLRAERLVPVVTARTYNYFKIQPNRLNVHAELIFTIKQARQEELKFDLPLESPKSISIRGHGVALKDYQSEDTETRRQWVVQLAKPQKGTVHLFVDFSIPMEEADLESLELSPVIVRDVSFQSSMLTVEGSSELDIEIDTESRSVDVGEFAEAVYQPGRYMLGAYAWPNENLSLTVKSERRPIYQLPSAIVERAEMVTSVSTNGKAQTAARFLLATKQQPFLRVELPTDATLWSVQLDGSPAKPQRQDGALLISLIGNKAGKIRDLQLVFEAPATPFNFVGEIKSYAPELWLDQSASAKGLPVPLVDLHWKLMLPDGFAVSYSDGSFQSDQLVGQWSPLEQLGNWIYQLGGGIGRVQPTSVLANRRWSSIGGMESDGVAMPQTKALPQSDAAKPASDDPFSDPEDVEFFGGGRGEEMVQRENSPFELGADVGSEEVGELKAGTKGSAVRGRPVVPSKKGQAWALSGLRSLNIELTDSQNAIDFHNLGEQPVLTTTIVNQSRVNWFAISTSLLIVLLGVMLTHRKLRAKVFYVLLVVVVACLVPLLGETFDAFRAVVDLSILAAVLVAIYFVVAALFGLLGRSASFIVARIPIMVCLFAVSLAFSNQGFAQQVVNDAKELKRLISELQTDPSVELPSDAIIIPFDPSDPAGRAAAEKRLIPYEHYLDLLNRSRRDPARKIEDAPAEYVFSSAEYALKLTQNEDVSVMGTLVIEVLTDDPVSVSMPLLGGALADAKVDGKPAKLQFVTPGKRVTPAQQSSNNQQLSSAQPSVDLASVVKLHLEGRGTKVFEFTVRMKPIRQGGWRSLNARLPVGVTRGLKLTSPDELTEIRLSSESDRRSIESKPNQELATVLNKDGSLRLQWKPSTAARTVDQSLTANSEAIFDVREDGLRLTWRVDLDFRGSERDVFTLILPPGFLVEKVTGDNIRAWDVKADGEVSGDQQRLNVTLLGSAKDQEAFTVELSQREFVVDEGARKFDAPFLSVEGAALHKGIYTVRRSPIVELKTTGQRAANRVDEHQGECKIDVAGVDANSSPLGIESFQCLQFLTTPFRIGLQAKLVPRTITAKTKSVLRIGQSEADWEMKIDVAVGKRPIYELSLDLPVDAEIRRLSAGVDETWSVEDVDGAKRVQFFFPRGVSSDFSILLEAALTEFSNELKDGDQWSIPHVKVNDVQDQSGQIAIQVDPAISVATQGLEDCSTILMQQIESWLTPAQRSSTRLALETKGSEYEASLRFTKIQPRVSVETITNVRTTLFAIEETVLLDFDIRQAGIREIQFELPAYMRNARVVAKLLSDTKIEDVEGADAVRFTLGLHDEVIDSFRVVIENDRQLASEPQGVPVPLVLTGSTEQRYVTLQNSGRDEIEVLPTKDFRKLNRQLSQFAKLQQKLSGGELTLAYFVDGQNDWPKLQYEMKQREVIDTVAASIEFSKTTMVVDSSGAYRALQNFQVNNRSEQYLEIELPEGAQLLTVVVENQPVKPVAWPAAQNDRRLRIPLVKTPLGDLDYPVQLKYAGRLAAGELASFEEIEFPVIETLNINVQLSQLHLRLPETHQWMNFSGTMTKVDSRGGLEESYLSYKSRQIQKLAEQIQSSTSEFGSFSKSRAYRNLKTLESEMKSFAGKSASRSDYSSGKDLQVLIEGNKAAIERAQQNYSVQAGQSVGAQVDNRDGFNDLVKNQSAKIARNSITGGRGGQNFFIQELEAQKLARMNVPRQQAAQQREMPNPEPNANSQFANGDGQQAGGNAGKGKFDSRWLNRNNLDNVKPGGDGLIETSGSIVDNESLGQGKNQGKNQGGNRSGNRSRFQEQSEINFLNSMDQLALVDKDELRKLNDKNRKLEGSSWGGENLDRKSTSRGSSVEAQMRRRGGGGMGVGMEGEGGGMMGGGGGVGRGGGGMGGEEQQEGGGELQGFQSESLEAQVQRAPGLVAPSDGLGFRFSRSATEEAAAQAGTWRDGSRGVGDDAMNASLTSLDIELPARGMDFYFKSPRGKATVTVRPLETRSLSRIMSAGIGIVCAFVAWLLCWLVMRAGRNAAMRGIAIVGLFLVGLVSVVAGFLPIYGLLAIATSFAFFVNWMTSFVESGSDQVEVV